MGDSYNSAKQPFSNGVYDSGSFRDPSGRVFSFQGRIFREFTEDNFNIFLKFLNNPLHEKLVREGKIVWSKKTDLNLGQAAVVEHKKINFLSYIYEWSPREIFDAGLFILDLQKELLEAGFCLKDATPFNVQFERGKPVWIDVPSIVEFDNKPAWVAYNQFCRFFIYPLLISHYARVSLRELLLSNLEGVSFEDCLAALPKRAKFNPKLFTDITLPAILQKFIKESASHKIIAGQKNHPYAKELQLKTLARLKKILSSFQKDEKTFWVSYEKTKTYSEESTKEKIEFVEKSLAGTGAAPVLDVGANTGLFSRLAARTLPDARIVSIDYDAGSIDALYLENKAAGGNILPLVMDITAPTPSLGWMLKERKSFLERADFNAVLALAVIHHLRVAKNIPLEEIAGLFASLASKYLIIEFIGRDDSMFKRLTAIREDTFGDYTQENFEKLFAKFFNLKGKKALPMSARTLYLYEKK